jgi:hypothetical protein
MSWSRACASASTAPFPPSARRTARWNTTVTGGQLHRRRRIAVEGGYGDRHPERPAHGSVLPELRPARQQDPRDHGAGADPIAPGYPPPVAAVGVRTFAQINSSLSKLTGVPTTNSAVMQTYTTVQQQLPVRSDPGELLLGQPGGHRAAGDPVLQHRGQYAVSGPASCSPACRASTASVFGATGRRPEPPRSAARSRPGGRHRSYHPAGGVRGQQRDSQHDRQALHVVGLHDHTRAKAVTAAACAAALGSADMLIN